MCDERTVNYPGRPSQRARGKEGYSGGCCNRNLTHVRYKAYATDMDCFVPLIEKFKETCGFYAAGISFFLLVQLAYLYNLKGMSFSWRALFFLPLGVFLPLTVLGGLYAFLFLLHFFLALQKEKAQPSLSRKLYLLGLVLFICCDMAVVWGYFFTPVPHPVWLFYAPSQLLLALTAKSFTAKA